MPVFNVDMQLECEIKSSFDTCGAAWPLNVGEVYLPPPPHSSPLWPSTHSLKKYSGELGDPPERIFRNDVAVCRRSDKEISWQESSSTG